MRRTYDIKILGVAGVVLAAAYFTADNQPCRTVYYNDYKQCTTYNQPSNCHMTSENTWSAEVCSDSHYHGRHGYGYSGMGSSAESFHSSRGGFGRSGRFFGSFGG